MPVTFLVGFAAVFGTAEALRHTQARSRRQEHRSRKNNLNVHCIKSTRYSSQVEGKQIVLSGDKLYVDTGEEWDEPFGYPFAGYFLAYPDAPYTGLVSQIMDDPPMMNWIYVDKDTHEVKFGTRAWAEPNYTGPFDCTRQDRRLTFGGWEGFCLVKEGDFWGLYFDLDDDMLRSKVPKGTPVLEIELTRKEMRVKRPPKKEPEEEKTDWKMNKPKGFASTEDENGEGERQAEEQSGEQTIEAQAQLGAQQNSGETQPWDEAKEQTQQSQSEEGEQRIMAERQVPDTRDAQHSSNQPEEQKADAEGEEQSPPVDERRTEDEPSTSSTSEPPPQLPSTLGEERMRDEEEAAPEEVRSPSQGTWDASSSDTATEDDRPPDRESSNGSRGGYYRSPSVEQTLDRGENYGYRPPSVEDDLEELESEEVD